MPGVQQEIVDSFADLFPACEGELFSNMTVDAC